MIEVESEAHGGSLYQAENRLQVAVLIASTHCDNSLRWLLKQALHSLVQPAIDSVAFTVALTKQIAAIHIHYYPELDSCFHMSKLRSFLPERHADVQECHSMIKNIPEYGLIVRQTSVREALARLLYMYPWPKSWNSLLR